MSAITFDPESSWQSSFTFNHVKCLIVCRGPIRLETMNIFKELGATYGMLLSEKDSIIFRKPLLQNYVQLETAVNRYIMSQITWAPQRRKELSG